ncbi:MAG: DUF192 domain-containing protein [Candidatus Microgenomates bacterium]|jgi:hypothetical protein
MIKNLLLPFLGVIAFIVIVGVFFQKTQNTNPGQVQKTVTIASKAINVEVADTPAERAQGLSGRSSLAADSGMLFVFETKAVTPIFWMKDMLIPLDFIWIGGGRVVRIDKNVPFPAPGTPDANLKTYTAGEPIDYVLEVNGGFSDTNSIKVGDPVTLSGI